jgi:non-ribosomal peptide synthetase component F
MVEAQAALIPDAVAVTAGIAAYRELNEIANGWAHRLRSFGVAPDVCVGIYMGRSPAMIAAVLAVLKAGGAYLPLDPKYPAARIAFMIEDARAPVILSERLASEIAAADARIILFDADDGPNPRPDVPSVPTSLDHLAYVGEVPFRREFLHEPLERHVLIGVGVEGGTMPYRMFHRPNRE